MLPPIPSSILRSTANVKVCTSIDTYQNQVYGKSYTVQRVHLQPTEKIIKTPENTDQQLKSILFVDARRSTPALDWQSLFQSAHKIGGDMRVIMHGMEYTVVAVDALYDTSDRFHHWEISLS